MKFFNNKTPASEPKGSNKTKSHGAPAQAARQHHPAKQAQPQNRTLHILTKKEEIPFHVSVLSAQGNVIELPEEWRKNYAVLLVSREKKEVEIVCSTDLIKKTGTDDDLLTIVDQIKRNGFIRTRKWMARPEIISIIYEATENQKTLEEQQRTATKIQIEFDELVAQAMRMDTSDIHIEVRRDEARVRFRRNGDLFEYTQWPVRHARTMAGVIYQVIAEEKDTTFDEMKPQDAIIDRDLGELGRIRVRLATLPGYPAGFDMIMRILKMGVSGKRRSLETLGYNKNQLSKTRRAVAKPVGAVVMAGTTGSGKSTSLNSMLGEKIEAYGGRIKVITVEDPPEYLLLGATQVPVVRSRSSAKSGDASANPFTSVVRAAMRSDPDILMVGEVRDEASAELLIHAVQSGHQVFTTIHASSAIDIVARMRSNGIPDDVLGGQNFFSALMYQTLLPMVCKKCSHTVSEFAKSAKTEQEYELLHRIFKYLKPAQASQLRFRNDAGCPHCELGVIGRSVAAEVLLTDPHMLKCFRERRDADALLHYRHKGGKIALDHGLLKAMQGHCDIRDVEHKLDQITALDELNYSTKVFVDGAYVQSEPFIIDINDLVEGEEVADEAEEARKKKHFLQNFLEFIEQRDPTPEKEPARDLTVPDEKPVAPVEQRVRVEPVFDALPIDKQVEETSPTALLMPVEAIQPNETRANTVAEQPAEFDTEPVQAGIAAPSSQVIVASIVEDPVVSELHDGGRMQHTLVAPEVETVKTVDMVDSAIELAGEATNDSELNPDLSTANVVVQAESDCSLEVVQPVVEDEGLPPVSLDEHINRRGSVEDPVVDFMVQANTPDPVDLSPESAAGHPLNKHELTKTPSTEPKAVVASSSQASKPAKHQTPKLKTTATRKPMSRVETLLLLVEEALTPELTRNGIELTAKFIAARASEASLFAMVRNEALPESLRDAITELAGDKVLMEEIQSMTPNDLFEALRRVSPPKFKSKLLGGSVSPQEKPRNSKSAKPVHSLEEARKKRKPTHKDQDEE